MFYELLNILNFDYFSYKEGMLGSKKKSKRAKKKAKNASNEANQFADGISSLVSSTANEIQGKMNESSYSACNRDLIPSKEDLSILLDKLYYVKGTKKKGWDVYLKNALKWQNKLFFVLF